MRVIVLSDTHAPRRWHGCPPKVAEYLRDADLILHAGDVCAADVLAELAAYAPVEDRFELDGLRVGMIHDAGAAVGRTARMHRRFPDAELVVFGHSHIPLDQSGDGVRIFNPGSPTDRRRQPQGTIGVLEISDGRLLAAQIVPVT